MLLRSNKNRFYCPIVKVLFAFEGRDLRMAQILPMLPLICFIMFESMALILNMSLRHILINLCWCHPM